jgi:hypothetical protein
MSIGDFWNPSCRMLLCDVELMEVVGFEVGGHGSALRALVNLREHQGFERRTINLQLGGEGSTATGTAHHERLGHRVYRISVTRRFRARLVRAAEYLCFGDDG